MADQYPWYTLHTVSRCEQTVAETLQYMGFEVFLPCPAQAAAEARRSRNRLPSLFPGYLFCRMNLDARVPVLQVSGVRSILGIGHVPVAVPESEIDSVRTVLESRLPATKSELRAGQAVRVWQGPLRGAEGTLVNAGGGPILIVSITMLNRAVSVRITPEWVVAAESEWTNLLPRRQFVAAS